ncbi:MAG: DUF1385 domain-containing protein [Ruminococcaceae bacterium]|nr:DUF1385 domain-containing protein [Oscillospiraceae bacterium]
MKKEQEKISCALKTSIGGQALMEGIMMRGPKKTAMAVRNTKGEIVVEEFATKGAKRPAFCRWPIIRGVLGYIDSMVVGYKCLMRSAELSGLEDLVEESPKKKKKREAETLKTTVNASDVLEPEGVDAATVSADTAEKSPTAPLEEKNEEKKEEKLPAWVFTLTMVLSVVLAVAIMLGLFIFVPTFLFQLIRPYVPFFNTENIAVNSLWKAVFEGVFKIILIVGYMALISLMKDIRRTFMYHGAEHKTIFCYEAGLELTVENVRKQRRFHPRCGTSFLILMLLVSIFISFFIDPISILIMGTELPTVLRTLVKFLLLPVVVGVGYELIKFAGRHDNLITRIISMPGVWLQHITVFEPTDDMIECAILAVKEVIPDDQSDKW